ncbi:MAG: T9SS type A sorting domain-containing protein, partial [Crocinitomicaceae bacterium]
VKGTGTDWLQTNYYFDGSYGSLIDQDGTDWKTLPQYVDQSTLFGGYDHVARALGNDAINGSVGSLPTTLTNTQSYTHTYTFTKDASWVLSKMHAIAILIKNSTGELLNAGQTPIIGTAGLTESTLTTFGVDAYPNPSNGAANIKVALENESSVSISVYNMIGEVVYQVPATTLAAGTHVYPINLMNTQSGVYFAHVSVNGTNQVVKINVVK